VSPARAPRTTSTAGTIAYALLAGVIAGWASIYAVPALVRWGVPEHAALRFPFLGFVFGVGLGRAMRSSPGVKDKVWSLLAPLVLGGLGYLAGVAVGGVMIFFGASDDAADYAPPICMALGGLLGLLGVIAVLGDLVLWFRKRSP
jgi:hypothetical protein